MTELICRQPEICAGKVKCVVVGDSGVGKTSLLATFKFNEFPAESSLNLHYMFSDYSTLLIVDDKEVHLHPWDTAGMPDYDALRILSYPETDVFLILFSLVNSASLDHVKTKWFAEVNTHCPNVPIILVGTKLDLRCNSKSLNEKNLTPIDFNDGAAVAYEMGAMKYVECSSLTQYGVQNVFEDSVRAALWQRSKKTKKRHCLLL